MGAAGLGVLSMKRTIALGVVLLCSSALAAGEPRKLGTFGAEVELAFSPDGAQVAVTTRGGSAALVDVVSGKVTTRYGGGEQESESAIAISRDGAKVALGTLEGTVRLFASRSGTELLALQASGPVRSLAFSHDGAGLAVGGGQARNPETDELDAAAPTARVFDTASGALVIGIDGESGNTGSAVAASSSGPIVAVARADGKLTLLNLAEKKRRVVELGSPSLAVAFSADGALVAATGGADGAAATLVDVTSGEVLRTLPAGNDPATPEGVLAFSPDGEVLARSHPGTPRVFLHSVETGKILRAFDLPEACASLAFSPDGTTIAVGLRTGDVLLHGNPLAR